MKKLLIATNIITALIIIGYFTYGYQQYQHAQANVEESAQIAMQNAKEAEKQREISEEQTAIAKLEVERAREGQMILEAKLEDCKTN